MGSNMATELADKDLFPTLTMEQGIAIHLRSNHYPPVPTEMVPVCIEAIEACNDDEANKAIEMPKIGNFQVTYKGQLTAPAWAIIEQHHLDAWVNDNE
jgi:hypothetical protein